MRVTKRSGAHEPIDVNKIVRAVARCCEGIPRCGPDARCRQDHRRPVRRRHHPRARRTVHPHGLVLHGRRSRLLEACGPAAVRLHRQGSAGPGNLFVLAVHPRGLRCRPDQRAGAAVHRIPCAQAQRHHRCRTHPQARILRLAHLVRSLRAEGADAAPGHRNAAVFLDAGRRGAQQRRARSDRAVPHVLLARLPAELTDAVQCRHSARAIVELLPARLAARLARRRLRQVPGHRAVVEILRRHRRRLASGALRGLAHPLHQRAVERHRALAQDPGFVRGRRQSGRQTQGSRLRLPRDLARRHRSLSRTARQHRR